MQTPVASKNDFFVRLSSVESRSFFNNLKDKEVELSPDTLRVAHSVAIIVLGYEELGVEIGLKYGNEEETYSEIRVSFRFGVIGLQNIMKIDQETKQVELDESLLRIIIPVSFSTARGYLSAKMEGSPLARYPYPIIGVDALIKTCQILLK